MTLVLGLQLFNILAFAALPLSQDCSRTSATTTVAHLEIAECYSRQARWREAEEHYRQATRMAPDNVSAVVGHAQTLVHLNQPYEAITELEELLETHESAVPALRLYAVLLARAFMERAAAIKTLERCVQLEPRDGASWSALGDLQFEATMAGEAARSYQEAIRIRGEDPLLIARLARCYAELNQEEAGREFERAVRLNRRSARPEALVYTFYGEYLLTRDRIQESLASLTEALALDAHNGDTYLSRAQAYEKAGEMRKAEQDALAAIRESGERIDARNLLRRVYRTLNEAQKAGEQAELIAKLSAAEEARQSAARSVRATLSTAKRLLDEGAFQEAAARYEDVVQQAPGYAEGLFALGVCYSQIRQADKAEQSFRDYIGQRPYLATGHAALGVLLLEKGWYAEARSELERAIELETDFAEAREALEQLKATVRTPGDSSLLKTDAKRALDAGDYAAAARILESCSLSESQWDPDMYSALATARSRLGRTTDALQLLERGLERHPSSQSLTERYLSALKPLPRQEQVRRLSVVVTRVPGSPALRAALEEARRSDTDVKGPKGH